MSILDTLNRIEAIAVDLVAKVAPWVSPLPTAYLTMRATVRHLSWPTPMGIISGVIIECLGLAATATALTLREYNKTRRKTDPTAPVGLALSLVGVYFGSITLLTILLDTTPALAAYAPLAFPILSLSGVAVLALRADHRQRLTAIEAERQERRDARRAHDMGGFRGAQDTGLGGQLVAQPGAQNAVLDVVNRTRQAVRAARLDALLRAYEADPNLGATGAARLLGVHRNTVYNYTAELEQSGRISRDDGNGVKVLERG